MDYSSVDQAGAFNTLLEYIHVHKQTMYNTHFFNVLLGEIYAHYEPCISLFHVLLTIMHMHTFHRKMANRTYGIQQSRFRENPTNFWT